MKNIILALLITICSFTLLSCNGNNQTIKESMIVDVYTDDEEKTQTRRNGVSYSYFDVTEEKTITFEFDRVSGKIDILIYRNEEPEKYYYEGHDIQLKIFTTKITNKGSYTIKVICKNYVGNYSITM